MGVPKFYRWLSERYPCLSEVITDAQIPEFDNLYLDMNGIIHNCSHPNDDDVTFRISEEQIFNDIFNYINNLFNVIKPQKVFFMAVDGVAPRAKMNQQRARRFMSAKNAEELHLKAEKAGADIPSEKRFDSNCITPGTQFMVELNKRLRNWVHEQLNKDARWRNMRIYLSGHDCPGEGEHKIMDFIRSERSNPEYDPNTRHCMYGLDADLIMLGICSHEPHFSLLREEVKFTRPPKANYKKAPQPPKKADDPTCFHLLHLSLLREYLAWEFVKVKDTLNFEYKMENIIDDWVLMGFLIGNDFIPHLPNVHIHDNALPVLYKTYMEVLPSLDGYINENGYLNLKRFEVFLKAFSRNDRDTFLQSMEDEEYLNSKMGGTGPADRVEDNLVKFDCSDDDSSKCDEGGEDQAFKSSDEDEDQSGGEFAKKRDDNSQGVLAHGGIRGAAEMLKEDQVEDPVDLSEQLATLQFRFTDDDQFANNVDNCWSRAINNDFKRHKKRYYSEKLKIGRITTNQLREQAEGYVRAIQWNLHYYYHGCCSWSWYFEHHYAPYISDVLEFADMQMEFDMSTPFLPFEQLLAVLPAASAECLPVLLRSLMCDEDSPIADFYPKEFSTDLNGKKNDWEAVVLVPFIDEKRLLEAIREKEKGLPAKDRERNVHGNHLLFTTREEPLNGDWCCCTEIDKDAFRISKEKVVHGLLPNVKLDVFFPDFPTMKHLPHIGKLINCNVKVFNMPSRKPSLMLSILDRPDLNREIEVVAADLLGEEVCVNWPMLKVGIVEEIWTDTIAFKRSYNEKRDAIDGEVVSETLDGEQKKRFKQWRIAAKEKLMERYAIEPGEVKAMARVRRLLGTAMTVMGDKVVASRQWAPAEISIAVPLQLVCVGVLVSESISRVPLSIKEAFPVNSKVFVMDPTWSGYGYPAVVKEITEENTPNCRVTVQCALPEEEVNLRQLRSDPSKFSLEWYNGFAMQRITGVKKNLIGRMTGTVYLMDCTQDELEADAAFRPSKLNIGLNLKLSKRNEETADYAKRLPEGFWIYSVLTAKAIAEYHDRFPEIFGYIEKSNSINDSYYSGDIWLNAEKRKERVGQLIDWLESLPSFSATKQAGGVEYADRLAVAHIESILSSTKQSCVFRKSAVVPAKIFRPSLNARSERVHADPDADFLLYDRVTFMQDNQDVPFGLTGTIIGKHGDDHVDVLFDREFPTATRIRSSSSSCARVLVSSLINITFAKDRKMEGAARESIGKWKEVGSKGNRKEKKEKEKMKDRRGLQGKSGKSAQDDSKGNKKEKKEEKMNDRRDLDDRSSMEGSRQGAGKVQLSARKKNYEAKREFNNKELRARPRTPPITDVFALLGISPPNVKTKKEENKEKSSDERREVEKIGESLGEQTSKLPPSVPHSNDKARDQFWGRHQKHYEHNQLEHQHHEQQHHNIQVEQQHHQQYLQPQHQQPQHHQRYHQQQHQQQHQQHQHQHYQQQKKRSCGGSDFEMAMRSDPGRGHGAPLQFGRISDAPHYEQQSYSRGGQGGGGGGSGQWRVNREVEMFDRDASHRPRTFYQPSGHAHVKGGGGRGGRRGRVYDEMLPEEYVKDKVTDLMPASVRGFGRGKAGRGGRPVCSAPQLSHKSPQHESTHNEHAPAAASLSLTSAVIGVSGAAAAAQPKQRRPRIALKLSAKSE